jgi:hypothetical protein
MSPLSEGALSNIWNGWSKYLLDENRERVAYQLGLYASEAWIASECAWAMRKLVPGEVVLERHLTGMKKGQRADLALLLPGLAGNEAVLFEFKAAWCESHKTVQETVRGVKADVAAREGLAAYSVVLGFKFDWSGRPAPGHFRWQPTKKDPVRSTAWSLNSPRASQRSA